MDNFFSDSKAEFKSKNTDVLYAHLQSLICRCSSSWEDFFNLYHRLDLRLYTSRDANTCKGKWKSNNKEGEYIEGLNLYYKGGRY